MIIFAKIFLLLIILSATVNGQTFFDRYDYSPEIMPLINSPGSEMSPSIVKGSLFYTAVRDESIESERLKQRNLTFYDVYTAQTDNKGYPRTLRRLVPGFGNTFHEGPVSWCEATGELFVTVSNLSGKDTLRKVINRDHIRLKLVIMKEQDEKWTVVEELPFNNPRYHFAHPAISATGDTLIFSSDMEGGFGNSDLYMAIRSDGQWSEPQNLGEKINTPGNEMFPTFGPGGIFMFSSDGLHDNLGNLDIYYYNTAEDSPVNLGEKLNSEYDDFGLVVHPSHEFGYFSSNRPGVGSDDIYRVEFLSLYEVITGLIEDGNEYPVPDATVYLQDCNGNDLQSTRTGADGRFRFEVPKDQCYQARVTKQGYKSEMKPYHLDNHVVLSINQVIKYRIATFDIDNDEAIAGTEIFCNELRWTANESGIVEIDTDSLSMCDLRVTGNGYFDYIIDAEPYRFVPGADIVDTVRLFGKEEGKSYMLENIVFFLDKWRLLPESENELRKLVKLMKDNPTLKVELASHTDSRGEAQYNVWLSQKRSDSATDFLIENGISKDRIVSKGYGENRLINHCANGVPCSEAEHLQNRRTEFIVLEY